METQSVSEVSGSHDMKAIEKKKIIISAYQYSYKIEEGSPMVNWSQVRGQTKYGSKYPMKDRGVRRETLSGESFGARPGWRAWWPGLPRSLNQSPAVQHEALGGELTVLLLLTLAEPQ